MTKVLPLIEDYIWNGLSTTLILNTVLHPGSINTNRDYNILIIVLNFPKDQPDGPSKDDLDPSSFVNLKLAMQGKIAISLREECFVWNHSF